MSDISNIGLLTAIVALVAIGVPLFAIATVIFRFRTA
jgi:hypothetical protein